MLTKPEPTPIIRGQDAENLAKKLKLKSKITCQLCGEQWDKDPALEVPCPVCPAKVGQWCRRPSEHRAMLLHRPRIKAAEAAGKISKCPKGGKH